MSANVGGQAVLEGVMMRSPGTWAVTVRRADGELAPAVRSLAVSDRAAAWRPGLAALMTPMLR